ncbi:hypothetical protein NIES4073_82540 [Kalymmatonema gypsitolerans NIES-4073]|nr:hypothetical protein NIES4073_82540 [Scytonema sp. NIES-4073]
MDSAFGYVKFSVVCSLFSWRSRRPYALIEGRLGGNNVIIFINQIGLLYNNCLVAKLLLSERELSNKVSSTQGWLKNQLVATYAVFPP